MVLLKIIAFSFLPEIFCYTPFVNKIKAFLKTPSNKLRDVQTLKVFVPVTVTNPFVNSLVNLKRQHCNTVWFGVVIYYVFCLFVNSVAG